MARHRPLRLATLAMLFQVLTVSVASSCFFPNGTLQTDPVYQPCTNIAGAFSMCCATNRTKNQDTCLANGLCQNVVQNSGNTGFVPSFYRDTCTDKTWQSPQCLAICDTGSGPIDGSGTPTIGYDSNTVRVTQCGDGSFCCGRENNTCCVARNGVSIANTVGFTIASTTAPPSIVYSAADFTLVTAGSLTSLPATVTSSASLTSVMSPTAALINNPTASSASSSDQSGGLSSGAKTGLGVGIALGAVLIIAAVVGTCYWKRKRRNAEGPIGLPPTYTDAPPQPVEKYGKSRVAEKEGTFPMYEKDVPPLPINELSGSATNYELPVRNMHGRDSPMMVSELSVHSR